MERLFQATGLSPELLDCALKPLTTNGILTQSQGKYGDGILSFPSEVGGILTSSYFHGALALPKSFRKLQPRRVSQARPQKEPAMLEI